MFVEVVAFYLATSQALNASINWLGCVNKPVLVRLLTTFTWKSGSFTIRSLSRMNKCFCLVFSEEKIL